MDHTADDLQEVVFLIGPPRSGKTTAAKFLEQRGYKRISASEIIMRLLPLDGNSADRRQLIDRGEEMLREEGPEWFAQKLLEEASGHSKVVFDGIRPVQTIMTIRRARPKSRIIFLKASYDIRQKRHEQSPESYSISYDEVLGSSIERSAKQARHYGESISNEGTVPELYQALLAKLQGTASS